MTGFPNHVRDIILDRAGRQQYPGRDWADCERCGMVSGAIQIHHRQPRGRGGTRRAQVNRASNGVALCPQCHERVESDREQARRDGWLVSLFSRNPAGVPIHRFRGEERSVYLLDDGSLRFIEPGVRGA